MTLYKHQQEFKERMEDRMLLVWEMGTGKTIAACLWLKDGRDSNALVLCPKRVKQKWIDTLKEWDTKAKVVYKEEFKKSSLHKHSAIVIDEADEAASPLFIPKSRSQYTEKVYRLLQKNMDTPRLLLTATPVRSNVWNLHTLLMFLGKVIPFKKWRERFERLEDRPFLPRPAYFPVPGWQKLMAAGVRKYGDVVLMRDVVDLPPEETIEIKKKKKPPKLTEWEPKKRFVEEHKLEQEGKDKEIKQIGKEYRKVLVVAHYREQCEQLKDKLEKDRQTFLVYGGVKNQEDILKEANETDECYLIVQASLGAGFDADSFSAVIFASQSYSVRDTIQMKGRVRRIHNLHPVKYYHLLFGRCDKAVYDTIKKNKDFVPSEWKE